MANLQGFENFGGLTKSVNDLTPSGTADADGVKSKKNYLNSSHK
jgi:hypothetical protein